MKESRNGICVVVLAVMLLVFLAVAWWNSSTEESRLTRDQDPSDCILTGSEALTKYQEKPKCSDQIGGGELYNETPVCVLASIGPKSATDAFAMRHAQLTEDAAQAASDMNDVMDEMLNRSEIPADYAETMVALFRDKSQGDVIRDFAVQHIGLYAETLQMRGKYDSNSSESATLRDSLWDASKETHTIVAAAAFRALADMAMFDPSIDANRLDSRLASCIADTSASHAARVMAAQLCGERRVVAAKPTLARIAADRRELDPLRLAAANSAKLLAE